jgi:hypothetical protein
MVWLSFPSFMFHVKTLVAKFNQKSWFSEKKFNFIQKVDSNINTLGSFKQRNRRAFQIV